MMKCGEAGFLGGNGWLFEVIHPQLLYQGRDYWEWVKTSKLAAFSPLI